MAQLMPSVLPGSATEGEIIVARTMASLPDDCAVYHEPPIKDRKADIIAVAPDLGVIVMEVKDWNITQIEYADSYEVRIRKNDDAATLRNPYAQASEYMYSLMRLAEKSASSAILLQKGGKHRGKFGFPFNHLCVFPHITNQEIDANGFRLVFPENRTIAADDLEALQRLEGQALKQELQRFLALQFPFPPLNGNQMKVIRGIINPSAVARWTEDDFELLTHEQEEFARKDLHGHRILQGVTGSGKTIMLLARAKFLAGDGSKAVLLLCYNRLLSDYLRDQLASFSNIVVSTFDSWGARNGVHKEPEEADSHFGSRVLERLRGEARDRARFDAVLIDETQDFCLEWLMSARLALKDPDGGDFFLAGDGTQKTARSGRFTWKKAGIRAQGRTKYLDTNYRNTKNLLKPAARIVENRPASKDPEMDEDSFPVAGIDWRLARRSGADPVIVELKDRAAECRYAASLAETWIRDGIPVQGKMRTLRPRDIAILYPSRPQRDESAFEVLKQSLEAFAPVAILRGKDMRGSLQEDSIKLTTLQSVKGLEFMAVIMIWTDLAGESWFEGRNDSRTLLFVGMTRAREQLAVLHSRPFPLLEEVRAAIPSGRDG